MELVDENQLPSDLDAVALYFAMKDGQLIDLEVAAAAAIEWSRGLKAAAFALNPDYDYRVTLIVAAPGSSKWVARVERALSKVESSKPNQTAEKVNAGWQKVPLLFRAAIGLSIALPLTVVPTYEWYTDTEDFSPEQIQQIEAAVRKVQSDPQASHHRKQLYREVQRDPQISGIGAGVPKDLEWKPSHVIPASQFAEADGLFELQEDVVPTRRYQKELDVVLVTPRLQNAPRAWEFRQEGIPGSFRASMRDERFLAALDRSGIHETLRANIPMRIRLEINEELVDGEWRVANRGRSVVAVISPRVN
ncbi:MAG: hypothetical protein PGN21_07070 [Sphingomonas paucimobilis]